VVIRFERFTYFKPPALPEVTDFMVVPISHCIPSQENEEGSFTLMLGGGVLDGPPEE
jgi:hypothetical protein